MLPIRAPQKFPFFLNLAFWIWLWRPPGAFLELPQ
jgi:hypothetical protein